MASDVRTISATCLCGSAKHDIALPESVFPLKAAICHCNSCRHCTGTLCATAIELPSNYRPSEDLLRKLTSYNFSETLTNYHCGTCGTIMLYVRDAYTCIASGTLEQHEGNVVTSRYIHIADTLDGGFGDFLTHVNGKQIVRWPHRADEGEQLPLYWRSPSRPNPAPATSDRLHAYCKCRGVEFWIARPSERSTMGTAAWPDLIIPFNSDKPPPHADTWWLQAGGTKYLGGLCACDSCRLASGMEWVEWAFVPTIDITLDAEGKVPFAREFGTLKAYRSSSVATRHFCGTCGANVFWNGDERPHLIDVAVGLLDASEGARAESWLEWRTSRLSYREDAMPRANSLTLGVEEDLREYGKRVQGSPLDAGE